MRGVSPRTLTAIRRIELAHHVRGMVKSRVRAWRVASCGRPCHGEDHARFPDPFSCEDHWDRDQLDVVLRQLPRFAAQELHRVLRKIDAHHRTGCPGPRTCRWAARGR
jgi:hypothetical protein